LKNCFVEVGTRWDKNINHNFKMGLKHFNINIPIVLASNSKFEALLLLETIKIEFKSSPINYFFKMMLWFPKRRFFIIFTSMIQMDWIRHFIQKYVLWETQNFWKFITIVWDFFEAWALLYFHWVALLFLPCTNWNKIIFLYNKYVIYLNP